MDSTTKVCKDCGLEKPLEDFYRLYKDREGRMPYCKPCNNARRKETKRQALLPDYRPIRHHAKIEDGKKRCSRCGERKPLSDYVICNGAEHGYCRPCHKAWSKEYNQRPETRAKVQRQDRARRFGLSLQEYDALMESKQCAICGGTNGARHLAIDHSHAPGGTVRGLLCGRCNAGIAMFLDNPNLLMAAIAYLKKWESVSAA